VTLPFTQAEASRLLVDPRDARTRRWIIDDLSPMTRREAKLRMPYLFKDNLVGTIEEPMPFFFSCRHFDIEARVCGNYEDRPEACRDWPWKGGPPQHSNALPPTCSFNADIGKPVAMMPTRWRGQSEASE
jgi:Fe-S-cluster containining protein